MKDIFVSGFNEQPPNYPGGIWMLRDDQVVPLHSGPGVFGLCWSQAHALLLGVTRVEQLPVVAFRKVDGNRYVPLHVEYRHYIPARRAHGIYLFKNKLYVVAAQGDPDARLCTNEDYVGHYVGKVIISNLEVSADCVLISDSFVWNPYECDHHHHYNDILVDDNFIYLASFSTCDAQQRYISRGAVTRFSHKLSEPTIMTDELVAPHSLQLCEGKLFVCSSSTSSVMSVPLRVESRKTKLEFKTLNNFIRGLIVTSDYFFIGLSRSAGRTNSAHLTEAINGILKFNRKDGTTTKIEMPVNCDNVYSLAVLIQETT